MIRINYQIILRVISAILFFVGFIMLIPAIYSLYDRGPRLMHLLIISLSTILVSFVVFKALRNTPDDLGKREGYLIVLISWLFVGFISSLPYFIGQDHINFIDAIFESFSGLTTTGATIFNDIESLPDSILLWRSLTQWIGGMGIIVLTVAIFPILGIGGVELFVAESPGPTSNKIHPRIRETAKRLWLLYVGLTACLISLLKLNGMNWFDAINHGLTCIATGGFSTKNASIAYFDLPAIQYTLIIFMFIAGINYSIIYASIRGKFSVILRSEEFKAYFLFTLISIIGIAFLIFNHTEHSFERSFRESAFQVISMITTTGYVTADYTSWTSFGTIFFFFLLFAGACAGSTAGGIKFIRHTVFAKNSVLEFKRLLHPNALIRLKIDGEIVRPKILTHVLVFLLLYLFIFCIGTALMTILLSDFKQPLLTAAGAVASSLGNVGPAIAELGPLDNFSILPSSAKSLLCLIMLIGRLELFTVLIVFTPYFWKNN